MHRYYLNFTDGEEEFKRKGTTTPSARESWNRGGVQAQGNDYTL
jgi:hypothetical protein